MHVRFFKCITVFIITSAFLFGCAISDYPGLPAHRTHGEASMPEIRVSYSGFGQHKDGSFVHTTKYNNRDWQKPGFSHKVYLFAYINTVLNSYPQRPGITVDGSSYNGSRGFGGGDFYLHWLAIDTDPDRYGMHGNMDQRFPLNDKGEWVPPVVTVGMSGLLKEVDSTDWDLQSNVKNASQIMSSLILNGGNLDKLNLRIVSMRLNDKTIKVNNYPLDVSITGYSELELTIRNSPELRVLLNDILKNTEDMNPTSLHFTFSNNMEVSLPRGMVMAFSHKGLNEIIQQQ